MNNTMKAKQLAFELQEKLRYIKADMEIFNPEKYKDRIILLELLDLRDFIEYKLLPLSDSICDTCLNELEVLEDDQD